MSYIHEALKKAQVERDLGQGFQSGLPAPLQKKIFFTKRKTIFLGTALLLLLLAFAGYSWWYLINKKSSGGAKKEHHAGQSANGLQKRINRRGC